MQKLLALLFLIASIALASCTSPSASPAATVDSGSSVPPEYAGKTNPLGAAAASAGATVYQANCVACHGPDGRGDGPAAAALNPAPADLTLVSHSAPDATLFWRVSRGVPGSAMPAWDSLLTDEQIWQVISYIRTLN